MSFPSLPSSVDRYVRETLNRMLGRTGNAGDKVLFQSDLVKLGLVKEKGSALNKPAKPNSTITDNLKPVVGQVVPDKPTTPEGLSAAGTFGAVILQWTPPVYKGHNRTEIWRAQINDREQASMVHEANGSRYADVIGSATEHYYWIRHVNSAGQTSGYNQLGGTLGSSTTTIDVESLVLEHPQITERPFTVLNLGTEETPNYVIALNADIALNGQLNISQLQSGELQNGTALTIGQGSIELSTASDGYGQLVITGQGGIATNDYLVIKQGRIESFVYTASAGHVRYKEVRRNESGTATSGQQVKIPAYFKSQPDIHLYPRDISIYNASHPVQSQRLEIWHSDPVPHPSEAGAWLFTPYARLALADGSETVAVNWQYAGGSNSQSWTATGISNLKGATVYTRCGSYRRANGTTYQNRQVTVYLEYKASSSSSWALGASRVVNVNQFTLHSLSLNKTLRTGQYDVRVRFVAADRSGTFSSGSVTYQYAARPASGSPAKTTYSYNGNSDQYPTVSMGVSMPGMPGWEVINIDFQYIVDITIRVRNGINWGGDVRTGIARVKLPVSGGAYKTCEHIATSHDWKKYTYNDITITLSDNRYKHGRIKPDISLFYTGGAHRTTNSIGNGSGPMELTAEIIMNIKSIKAVIRYRRVVNNPVTYNACYMASARYDRGATDISLSNAVITWTASGE